ncbi:hypothetical protein DRU93_21150 [Salmonella enterica subsp. enterica]|nr:hypothetical protein [Salmonella enterica subsp. enterica]ECE8386345.1 hypothetical protein [Salmonella enterica subsp. enterica]ECI5115316.1 hypothetical protein [Salmonella enterica subsp. enterica]ECI7344805.1 hypothetical protein [Salmonella enterica subsp. enterica]
MIWQPEFTDKTLSRKPGAVQMASPIELHIGDHVQRHGALSEVMHIVESKCDIPGGIRVAACI